LILLEPCDDPTITKKLLGEKYEKALETAKKLVSDRKGMSKMPKELSIPDEFGYALTVQKFLSVADPNS